MSVYEEALRRLQDKYRSSAPPASESAEDPYRAATDSLTKKYSIAPLPQPERPPPQAATQPPSLPAPSPDTSPKLEAPKRSPYLLDQIATELKDVKPASIQEIRDFQKTQKTTPAERFRLAGDIERGKVQIADLAPDQVPWDQLMSRPGYTQVAALGLRDPQKAYDYLVQLQGKMTGTAEERQSLQAPSFAGGVAQGLSSGLALGVPEVAPGRTRAESAGQFAGQVLGMVPGVLGAAATGGAAAAGAAARAVPALTGRNLAARAALGAAHGLGTGATLAVAQEGLRAATGDDWNLREATGRAAETTGTYAAFGAAYPLAGAALGAAGRAVAQRAPAIGEAAAAAARIAPTATDVAEGTVRGAIAGGMVGLVEAAANAALDPEARGLVPVVRSIIESAGEEAGEELVEGIAYGIARGLLKGTDIPRAVIQYKRETGQAGQTPSDAPGAPETAPTDAGEATPQTPVSEPQAQPEAQSQRQVRSEILRAANPGMDERAIMDLVDTTRDLSDEEFAAFARRVGQPGATAQDEADTPPAPSTTVAERLRQKTEQEVGKGLAEEQGTADFGKIARAFTRRQGFEPIVTFDDAETEARFQAAKGVRPEPFIEKVKDFADSLVRKSTRAYEFLPNTPEFAEFRFRLTQLSKGKGIASDKAVRYVQGITSNLKDPAKYDLFTRAVILDDLMEEVQIQQRTARQSGQESAEVRLPFGFTPETLAQEHVKVMRAAQADKEVMQSLADRKAIQREVVESYLKAAEEAIGFRPELTRQAYFRHQVLDRINSSRAVRGTGEKLNAPTRRGYLRRRVGSELDINTEYIQAEHEALSQMLYDTEVFRMLKWARDKYDIKPKLEAQARKEKKSWRSLIPEGYVTWTPEPNKHAVFYQAWSLPERTVQSMLESGSEELGVKAEELRKVLAVAGIRNELVIPESVAKTLDHFGRPFVDPDSRVGIVDVPLKTAMSWWKQWQLVSPKRVIKYNLRNISGDLDATLAGNPGSLRKVPKAITDLYVFLIHGGAPTPELVSWMERGGMQDVLQVAENMGDLNGLKAFRGLVEKRSSNVLKGVWDKYWRTARMGTDFREFILRYANYLDYLEQIRSSPDGRPRNWGASIREEVMALPTPEDRAFKLANDLLGAYDEITVTGQILRDRLFPFWSWNEVNFRRHVRLIQNAIRDGQTMTSIGRQAAGKLAGVVVRSPLIAYNIGKLVVRASLFSAILAAWNALMFPEEQEELPDDVKSRPYIILGRDQDGKIIYFNRLGALHDFLEWCGVADAPAEVVDYLNGRKSLKEIVTEMARSPVNKLFQGLGPSKTIVELVTGKQFYPDVTRPRTIRDRWEFLADSFGLGDEYRELAGKPTRGYASSLQNLVVYKLDPAEAAYNEILHLKYRFLEQKRGASDFSATSPRSNALYNMKKALRYGDREAYDKYLLEYARLGGTAQGLRTSLRNLDPLAGMSNADKAEFVAGLGEEDRERLRKAYRFYSEVLLAGVTGYDEDTAEGDQE